MFSDHLANFDGLVAEKTLKGPAWANENELDAQADKYIEEATVLPQDDQTIESTFVHFGSVWAALSEPRTGHSTKVPAVARQQSQQINTIRAADLFAPNPFVQPSPLIAGSLVYSAAAGLGTSADKILVSTGFVSAFHSPTNEFGSWQGNYIGEEGGYIGEDSDTSGRETSQIEHLVGQLRNLPNLHDNWDGYGGVTPERDAVEFAVAFLNLVSKEISGLPVPRPSLAGSGEVGMYWSFSEHGFYGDIGFFADGRMNYYVEIKSGRYASEGGIMFDRNKLPNQFIDLLKAATSKVATSKLE